MKKYKQGEVITNVNEIVGEEFIYSRHKIYHKGWFSQWSLRSILFEIERGFLRKAIKIEEVKE